MMSKEILELIEYIKKEAVFKKHLRSKWEQIDGGKELTEAKQKIVTQTLSDYDKHIAKLNRIAEVLEEYRYGKYGAEVV
jgi:hypothetical protein